MAKSAESITPHAKSTLDNAHEITLLVADRHRLPLF
jgi:hypothetical protein